MRSYVTTSWDDGGPLDLRLAELLSDYGVSGTFYWTADTEEHPLPSSRDIAKLLALDMEVGSHTMTHPVLTAIDDDALLWELEESKARLENLTGREIPSFCYPGGYFNNRVAKAVADAGYRLARTTVGFRTDAGPDPFHFPVTIQIYPHGRRVHLSHAVKERNVVGLTKWATAYGAGTDLAALATAALAEIQEGGGILHLWGHSWELDEFGLWPDLENILELVAGHSGINYMTNAQILDDLALE